MSLSPDGTKLAALHLSGALSLWQVPSLRHKRTWTQDDQVLFKGALGHWLLQVSVVFAAKIYHTS